MGDTTKIEWCDATFNPWIGCASVSPGCDHCYAERMAKRIGVDWGTYALRKPMSDAYWQKPHVWNRRAARTGRRISVFPSMCDPFDKNAPPGARERLWKLIEETPFLDWLLLTKRIGRVARMVPESWMVGFPPNVWLGITVVNQEEADRDIPKLLALPARVRFLSCEPLLGPITMCWQAWKGKTASLVIENPSIDWSAIRNVDWVIVGGESGPGARPFDVAWARRIVAQCKAAGTACFVKQFGAYPVDTEDAGTHEWPDGPASRALSGSLPYGPVRIPLRDNKGGDWWEWPQDLRVREFPTP